MDDWDTLLGDNPRIAPDIHFKVTEVVFVDGTPETKTEVFGAHKFVLSMVSDVFKALFFGTMREETEEILIRDTTIEAFKEFLKIIYILSNTKRCETQVTDVKLLFEILNLAKRYMIPKAVSFLEERLSSVDLTETNVVPTVILAHEYKALEGFQAVSEQILETCSHFLQETFSTNFKLFQFLAQVEATFSVEWLGLIVQLLARANCKNCKASPCLDGKEVTNDNAVPGSKVKVSGFNGEEILCPWDSSPDGHGIIVKGDDDEYPWWIHSRECRPLCILDSVTYACS